MRLRYLINFITLNLLFITCFQDKTGTVFKTNSFQLVINEKGAITRFIDRKTGINYLYEDTTASLMSVRLMSEVLSTESMEFDEEYQILKLHYKNDIEAKIRIEPKSTHLTFELMDISNPADVELIVWGPYPTTIGEIVGETVGVVRGTEYAIGIQAMNPKTLGGYPWNENDCMPQLDIFEQDDLSDLSEKGKRHVLYRVEAAKPTGFGSSLQAYCRNRNKERIIENWNHEKYVAPVFDDGGVIGSKIALFGCPVEETLDTIGKIEVAEGLAHPMIDGEWGKTSSSASAAYLIMDFGEEDVEKALEITKKAGLRYLYHSDPFEYWGHFKLKEKQFPDGIQSMQRCVEKAESHGIMLGVHILSNFITTNDPYVTPLPDNRLARVGTSIITEAIDEGRTAIPIESPDFFNQFKNNHLKTVVIGDELIRYGGVSEKAPWMLLDCHRGAFGTTASNHDKGDKIAKLADHAYKVFLTNPELSIGVSKNIADLFNKTGLRQISFDGLEGNRSTGMGNYGEVLFTQTWFDNLSDKIKQHYIADASRTSHFFWHVYTRMNWGEPWYAGFRESQTAYRLKNQKYFKRNLMPGMLGWFNLTSQTSIEDIEWMLARSAAFDAGYAFCTGYKILDENGHSEKILKFLGEWERARMSGAFSVAQKQRMENIQNEYHLETIDENTWNLYSIYSYKFKHEKKERQPGEPSHSTFSFQNPSVEQTMQFILTPVDGHVENISMEIDHDKNISLPVTLTAGEILQYSGGNRAIIYSTNWQELKEIEMDVSVLSISKGEHMMTFDCTMTGGKEPHTKLEVRLTGPVEKIQAK